MTSTEQQIKQLAKRIAKLYFVDRDYKKLAFYLDEDITWIGTGKNEICLNTEEAILFFTKEQEVYQNNFRILEEWYDAKMITDDVCNVMAVIKIDVDMNNATLSDGCLRFSCILKKKLGLWRIVHVHNSIADISQGEETYFNLDISKSNYQTVAESIHKAAYTDPLTQISNLQGFEDNVTEILKRNPSTKYAIIKFGIQNFRFINREYGYKTGDQVLMNIAKNLTKSLKENETCGRMEKNVFCMLYKVKSSEELDKRMMRVRRTMLDKRLTNKIGMDIQLTAGIYIIRNNKEEYIKDMTDKALIALQNVDKSVIGSHFTYYDDWMMNKQYLNAKVLDDAPRAMQNEEFVLYIQPQFDIQTREVIAGEALTRWQLKDGTIRMPNEFIDVFEQRGMILSFDFYMLDQVCRKMREWIDKGEILSPISINQSRLHIEEESYLKDFCSVVDKYDIPHHYIAFELTESTFVENSEKMMKLANQLHKEGFQLAIDDFGTGYASLNLLSVVSADILKIDKSLLNDYDTNHRSRIVMQKIVELAHQMDMKVVCEGIETEDQLSYVRDMKCDIGQGFLIGKPMAADDFAEKWMTLKEREEV